MTRMISSIRNIVVLACLFWTSLPHYANTFITLPCEENMMIIEEELSFKDAEARCKSYNYSGLAVLHNQKALDSFLKTITDHASTTSDDYWVGLTYVNSLRGWRYRWSNGYFHTKNFTILHGCGRADSKGNDGPVNCNECRKSICADYVDHRNIITPLEDTNLTQAQADAKCKERGFDRLAVLNSQEKMDYAIDEKSPSDHWIGMRVNKSYEMQWVSGDRVTWVIWSPPDSEPDFLETQKCVRLSSVGFATKPCGQRYYAICENTTGVDYGNASCYLEDATFTQAEADAKCKEKGFDGLAILDSQAKMDHAIARKRAGTHWVGMVVISIHQFQWHSGENVTWASWSPVTEPDDLDAQKCVRLDENGFGTMRCDQTMYAVCERTKVPECPVHVPVNATPPSILQFRPKIQITGALPKNDSDVMGTTQARSLMECSVICFWKDGCKSSAYHEGSKMCSSHLHYFTAQMWEKDLGLADGWTVVDKCG